MKTFTPRLLLQAREQIKQSTGIDVLHTANTVRRIKHATELSHHWGDRNLAVYDITGTTGGKSYNIRLYTRYGKGFGVEGKTYDASGFGVFDIRLAVNLTIGDRDTVDLFMDGGFPDVGDGIIRREDICEESWIPVMDENDIDYCEPANRAPIITPNGPNPLVITERDAFSPPNATVIDPEEGPITPPITVVNNVNNLIPGTYNVTYTATDSFGLEGTGILVVIVLADEAPVVTAAGDVTEVSVVENTAGFTLPVVTAVDREDGDLTADITVQGTYDIATVGDYTINYSVLDSVGQVGSLSLVVHVTQNILPTITLDAGNEAYHQVGTLYQQPTFSASDAEDGDLTSLVTITGALDPQTVGDYTRTYAVADFNNGTATETLLIHVVNLPTLTLLTATGSDALTPLEIVRNTPRNAVVSAQDIAGNDISGDIVVTNGADITTTGDYVESYTVTDPISGFTNTLDVYVKVINPEPSIVLAGDADMFYAMDTTWVDPGYTATDADGNTLNSAVQITGAPDTSISNDYTLVYSVEDSTGAVTSTTRLVRVRAVPVITLGPDTFGNIVDIWVAVNGTRSDTVTAVDFGGADISANIVRDQVADLTAIGITLETYTVTDPTTGLMASASRNVHVANPPVITLAGDLSMKILLNSNYVDPGYTAVDYTNLSVSADVVISGTVDTSTLGVYTITYSVEDDYGMQSSVTRDVLVGDTPVVTLIGPTDVVVATGEAYTDAGATAVDENGNPLTTVITEDTVDVMTPGAYIITYTATNGDGFTDSKTRNILVRNRPEIVLASDLHIYVGTDRVYVAPSYTATDSEGNDLTANVVVVGTVNTAAMGDYTIQYTLADATGLTAIPVDLLVTVHDAPTVKPNATDPTYVGHGDAFVDPGARATDYLGNVIDQDVVTTGDVVDTTIDGTYTRTYGVTGPDGLYTEMDVNYIVVPYPALSVSSVGRTLATGTVLVLPEATAIDYQSIDISGSVTTAHTIDMNVAGDYDVVYTIQDPVTTLVTSLTVTVTVKAAPTLTILGNNPETVEINAAYIDAGATAVDAAGTSLTSAITVDNQVDNTTEGNYTVTYSVTDGDGLTSTAVRSVDVYIPNPVITLIGGSEYIPVGGTYTEPGYTAVDYQNTDITALVTSTDNIDNTTVGAYTVEYTVTDSNGKVSDPISRSVSVRALPVISLTGDDPQIVALGGTYTDLGATAIDSDGNDISLNVTVTNDVDATVSGSYAATYSVTDDFGIDGLPRGRVVIVDSYPAITLLGNPTEVIETGSAYIDAGATASDLEDGDITADIVVVNTVDTAVAGTYTVTYSVTDSVGVSAPDVVRTVTVHDKPTITDLGVNPMAVLSGSVWTDPGVLAEDYQGTDLSASLVVVDNVDTAIDGTYTVTYDVVDADGFSADTFTRTVIVHAAPTMALLGANPLSVIEDDPYTDPGVLAEDYQGTDISANVVITGNLDTTTPGDYVSIYNITDADGFAGPQLTRDITVTAKP